ncbi:MAG: sulfotransferase, partial [Verrucomicrobiales bacterium]
MSASKPPFLEPEIRESLRHVSVRGGRVELRAFPDFLIIGPQRTGTTWLHENLRSHPQLFLPKGKESYYFSTLGRPEHPKFRYSELEDYLGAMDDGCRDRLRKTAHCLLNFGQLYRPEVRGEATATYAKLPGEVIAEICRINPEIKAVLMLRDPLERAWSHAKKDLVDSSGGPASQIPAV